jgi:hypothetical protein
MVIWVNHAALEMGGAVPKGTPGRKYKSLWRVREVNSQFWDWKYGIKPGDLVLIRHQDVKMVKLQQYHGKRHVRIACAHVSTMEKFEEGASP